MTVKRFLLVFVVGVLLQASVFAVYYNDLLFLRQPVALIAIGSEDTFTRHAADAFRRAGQFARAEQIYLDLLNLNGAPKTDP